MGKASCRDVDILGSNFGKTCICTHLNISPSYICIYILYECREWMAIHQNVHLYKGWGRVYGYRKIKIEQKWVLSHTQLLKILRAQLCRLGEEEKGVPFSPQISALLGVSGRPTGSTNAQSARVSCLMWHRFGTEWDAYSSCLVETLPVPSVCLGKLHVVLNFAF